jgi:uncharacterized membrane protein
MLEERPQAAVAVRAPEQPATRVPSAYRDPVTWAVAVSAGGCYLVLSLFRLLTLHPSSWDLGIYTEYVKQLAHLRAPIVDVRGAGFNLLGDHFQVIVALIAPFFRVFPSSATLLAAQALLVAVSVFPVTAAAVWLLGRGAGRCVGFAYGFSWGLQQMVDFDFHEIAFAVPLLAFSLSALVRGRPRAAVWWAMPLVFVKEDQGFTVAAIGLLMLTAGAFSGEAGGTGRGAWGTRGARLRAGWFLPTGKYSFGGGAFLTLWGMAWSVLAIMVIIPHFNADHRYLYWNDGGVLGSGAPFSATGLLAQTFHAWPVKLQAVVLLLLPTVFIALGSPIALIALPSIALRFLSTNSAYWGTLWHYNATVMPVLFIAAAAAIARWRALPDLAPGSRPAGAPGTPGAPGSPPADVTWWRSLRALAARHGAPIMLAMTVALAFQFPLSNLWSGSTYQISPHVAAANEAMAQVPDGATVQATLGLLAPLAARTDTFWIGNAGNPVTQYVVFDGADSGYSPAPGDVPAFIRELYPRDGYVEVFALDHVYVFRRG